MSVPDTVRTKRLLLRPWRAADAARLLPILETNTEHLGPWIPRRVAEPVPLPELEERLAGFAADFDAAREWRYGLFSLDGESVIGEVGLYPRDAERRVPFAESDRVEIGYWLRRDRTGEGLATEATRAALDIARSLSRFKHAEIRCDAKNTPSSAVPRRLGFELVRTEGEGLEVWMRSKRGEPPK